MEELAFCAMGTRLSPRNPQFGVVHIQFPFIGIV